MVTNVVVTGVMNEESSHPAEERLGSGLAPVCLGWKEAQLTLSTVDKLPMKYVHSEPRK